MIYCELCCREVGLWSYFCVRDDPESSSESEDNMEGDAVGEISLDVAPDAAKSPAEVEDTDVNGESHSVLDSVVDNHDTTDRKLEVDITEENTHSARETARNSSPETEGQDACQDSLPGSLADVGDNGANVEGLGEEENGGGLRNEQEEEYSLVLQLSPGSATNSSQNERDENSSPAEETPVTDSENHRQGPSTAGVTEEDKTVVDELQAEASIDTDGVSQSETDTQEKPDSDAGEPEYSGQSESSPSLASEVDSSDTSNKLGTCDSPQVEETESSVKPECVPDPLAAECAVLHVDVTEIQEAAQAETGLPPAVLPSETKDSDTDSERGSGIPVHDSPVGISVGTADVEDPDEIYPDSVGADIDVQVDKCEAEVDVPGEAYPDSADASSDVPVDEMEREGIQQPVSGNKLESLIQRLTEKAGRGSPELAATTDTVVEPATDTMAHPATDTMVQTATDTMVQTATDTMVHPATDTVAQAITDTMTQAATDTVAQTATDTMVQPATDTMVHPATDTIVHPATDTVLAADTMVQPAYTDTVLASDTMVQPTTDTMLADTIMQPATDTMIAADTMVQPATDTMLAADIMVQSATDTMVQPATDTMLADSIVQPTTDTMIAADIMVQLATGTVLAADTMMQSATDTMLQHEMDIPHDQHPSEPLDLNDLDEEMFQDIKYGDTDISMQAERLDRSVKESESALFSSEGNITGNIGAETMETEEAITMITDQDPEEQIIIQNMADPEQKDSESIQNQNFRLVCSDLPADSAHGKRDLEQAEAIEHDPVLIEMTQETLVSGEQEISRASSCDGSEQLSGSLQDSSSTDQGTGCEDVVGHETIHMIQAEVSGSCGNEHDETTCARKRSHSVMSATEPQVKKKKLKV